MFNILTKLWSTTNSRLPVLGHLLGTRDWVTPVAQLTYQSRFGVEIKDIKASLDPLFWWKDARLGDDKLQLFHSHDYTRREPGIPPWNSEPEVSSFLAKWILLRGASRVLELGCFTGFTSVHLASALAALQPCGQLTCVDGNARYLALAQRNLEQLVDGGNAPVMIEGYSNSTTVLEQLNGPFDLIFLDTSHEEEGTIQEIALYGPKLAPGGAFAFHDAIRYAGVRRAIAQAGEGYKKMIFATSDGNGLALLVKQDGPA